jgi:hypothetical protein
MKLKTIKNPANVISPISIHTLWMMATLVAMLSFAGYALTPHKTDPVRFEDVSIRYEPIQGIGPEAGMMRRDPSDVMKVGDSYYVWYTKVLEASPGYPEGYHGTLWFATSNDGVHWTERGEALGRGATNKFDAFGVFTPNVLYAPTTDSSICTTQEYAPTTIRTGTSKSSLEASA